MILHDVTLRDGNHALRHRISASQVSDYGRAAFEAGVRSIEVGHGNGLGGSSALIGRSTETDKALISSLVSSAPFSRIGVHSMPSFATIERDLKPALDCGVNYFRIGAHCTEVDTIGQHATFLKSQGVTVAAAIMMISHTSLDNILLEVAKAVAFGVDEVIFMDSVGRLTPTDVHELISAACQAHGVRIGFHAHDNLGLSVANSLSAMEAGASVVDVSALGMGAGAGNTPLELLTAAVHLSGKSCNVSVEQALRLARLAKSLGFTAPTRELIPLATSYVNIFSGFDSAIREASKTYQVDPLDLAFACLGKKLVAGQEDAIVELAQTLSLMAHGKLAL